MNDIALTRKALKAMKEDLKGLVFLTWDYYRYMETPYPRDVSRRLEKYRNMEFQEYLGPVNSHGSLNE